MKKNKTLTDFKNILAKQKNLEFKINQFLNQKQYQKLNQKGLETLLITLNRYYQVPQLQNKINQTIIHYKNTFPTGELFKPYEDQCQKNPNKKLKWWQKLKKEKSEDPKAKSHTTI